ncbi:hypothetical protein [Streptomyces sp. NBC_01373]|uniref:hypothetical protein n=1 Tax=unclassified Streptomyces TaxID=2593676 RepID=UPI0022563A8C|nr:hypothetical protein [Streptomyces sp. NBC_01373]MCX4703832.1 hypothetical protein [Streptomyces sp. NBC_01373]
MVPTGQAGLGAPAANIAVPAVLVALRTGAPYDNWMLVFDNAEDVEAVGSPPRGRCPETIARPEHR